MKNSSKKTKKSKNNITKLPDGSGCFTGVVMTKEEAMKLPPKKRPLCFRVPPELYTAVFESIGHASMCWHPHPGKCVFNTEEASKVATELLFKIASVLEESNKSV